MITTTGDVTADQGALLAHLLSDKSKNGYLFNPAYKHELELIQTQMAQKPMLRAEVGMRVHCANKASAE
jgi:hypothetical protein